MRKRIPNFKNEDQEREFWASRDSSDYIDWSKVKKVVLPKLTSSNGIVTNLNIQEICGIHTVTREDGKKIHQFILDHWDKASVIEIDFGNLEIASVSFLDEAIGQLALRLNRRELVSKLKLRRISSRDKRLLNDIFISRYHQLVKGKKKVE